MRNNSFAKNLAVVLAFSSDSAQAIVNVRATSRAICMIVALMNSRFLVSARIASSFIDSRNIGPS